MRALMGALALLVLTAVPGESQYTITATAVIVDALSDTDWRMDLRSGPAGLELHGSGPARSGSHVLGRLYLTSMTAAGERTTPLIRTESGRLMEEDAASSTAVPAFSEHLLRLRSAPPYQAGRRALTVTRVLAANS